MSDDLPISGQTFDRKKFICGKAAAAAAPAQVIPTSTAPDPVEVTR